MYLNMNKYIWGTFVKADNLLRLEMFTVLLQPFEWMWKDNHVCPTQ